MKLITAIVNKEDSKNVCNQLLKNKFYVTRLATTGGFLMAGNMTLLICTEDEKVERLHRHHLPVLQAAHRDRARHRHPGSGHRERPAHGSDRGRRYRHGHQRGAF